MQKECSIILSLAALALSFVAITGIHCFEMNVSDSVLTIIGVCATLIVGVSVVDALTIRNLQQKIERFDKLDKKVSRQLHQINILFHHTWGIQMWDKQPYTALSEFWRGFCIAAESDDIKKAKSCLENAKEVSNEIMEKLNSKTFISNQDKEQIPTEIPMFMKDTKVFCAFKEQAEALIDSINKYIINP